MDRVETVIGLGRPIVNGSHFDPDSPVDGMTDLAVVPGTGLKSRMNTGFASIWGNFFVPHAKIHFGVSRAQQGQSGKADDIFFV